MMMATLHVVLVLCMATYLLAESDDWFMDDAEWIRK